MNSTSSGWNGYGYTPKPTDGHVACTACYVRKSRSEFPVSADGLRQSTICKSCTKELEMMK